MKMTIAIATAAMTITTAAFAVNPDQKFVTQAYEDVLGRAPSRAEYTNWLKFIEARGSRMQFAAFLTSSAEYKNKLVEGWYMQFLRRDASSTEIATGANLLLNGATDKQIIAILIASDEYYRRAGGTDELFLRQVYADLLGRAPSPGETNAIIAVLLVNPTRSSIAGQVLGSVEYDQREAAAIYQKFLRRNPDTGESAYWTNLLASAPEEFEIDQLLGSDEYLVLCNK
jgi:hypothetical protein